METLTHMRLSPTGCKETIDHGGLRDVRLYILLFMFLHTKKIAVTTHRRDYNYKLNKLYQHWDKDN